MSEHDTAEALEQIARLKADSAVPETNDGVEFSDAMFVAAAKDRARIAAQEAEPLRTWCVRLKDVTVPTQQVHAHRVLNLGADGWPLFTVAPADARWIRFIVYRNGREDAVAMFRESEVLYAIETGVVTGMVTYDE